MNSNEPTYSSVKLHGTMCYVACHSERSEESLVAPADSSLHSE